MRLRKVFLSSRTYIFLANDLVKYSNMMQGSRNIRESILFIREDWPFADKGI